MGGLEVSTSRHERFVVLSLEGDLDDSTVQEAEARILAIVAAGPAPMHIVMDLTKIGFLTSTGVNLLATANFTVRSSRGSVRLVVAEGSPPRRVLEFTGVIRAIATYDSLEQALQPSVRRGPKSPT